MTELWIWECIDCELKTWSISPLRECQHCGGTLQKVGVMQRRNPTSNELTDFFKGLENFLGNENEGLS